jgi:signal transduction histidine kinase
VVVNDSGARAGTAPTGDVDAEPVALRIAGWHAAFWIMLALSGLFLLVTARLTTWQRLGGLGTLAVLGLAYAVLVHRRRLRFGWQSTTYLVVAVVVVGVAAAIDQGMSFLLFIVFPQSWMFSPTVRRGALVSFAAALSTGLGFGVRYGYSWATLRDVGPQLAVGLLFSMLLGVWISRVVAQSVERAELIEQLEAARTELNEAEHARGVMAERERMAREIHDTLAQGFTSIVMLAQAASAGLAKDPARAADRLAAIEDVARENLAEARVLVAAFTPVALENSTLPDAVRRLIERFAAETGITPDLQIAEAATRLDRDQEVVLLRAVQESLTNVRRHAGARTVRVRLLVDEQGARVEVGDDGVGFAPDEPSAGYGLTGMRGRVADVGGEMDVASSPGGGTTVTVQVPARTSPADTADGTEAR